MRCITLRDIQADMRHDIETIEDLIAELGGPTVIAEWLGISQEAVSNWKIRQNIPPGWHWKLAGAVYRKGQTINTKGVFGVDPEDAPFLASAVA